MRIRDAACLAIALLTCGSFAGTSARAEGPGLGEPLSPDEIPFYATYAMPDGRGLPAGQGTAGEGAALYAERCGTCHGATAEEGPILPLISTGSEFSQAAVAYWPHATALFDYIRRAMPFHQPKSLSPDETYAITAYLLFRNDVIAETVILDASSLPKVSMPNRDGFDDLWDRQGEKPF